MKNILIAIGIILLVAVFGWMLVIVLRPTPRSSVTFAPSISPQPSGAIIKVELHPEKKVAKVGEEISYAITVSSNQGLISGIEAQLTFDPTKIAILEASPGTFFVSPIVLTNILDTDVGTLYYALGTNQISDEKPNEAIVTIKTKILASTSASPILFDRNKTNVGLLSNDKSRAFTNTEKSLTFEEIPLKIEE